MQDILSEQADVVSRVLASGAWEETSLAQALCILVEDTFKTHLKAITANDVSRGGPATTAMTAFLVSMREFVMVQGQDMQTQINIVHNVVRPETIELEKLEHSVNEVESRHADSPLFYALVHTSQGEMIMNNAKASVSTRGEELTAEHEEKSLVELLTTLPLTAPATGVVDLVAWHEWGTRCAEAGALYKKLAGVRLLVSFCCRLGHLCNPPPLLIQ